MKFFDLNGKVHEIEPCEEAVIKKTVDGKVLYHTPKIKKSVTLGGAIDHISKIIATKPPYLRDGDIPWLLAHIYEWRKHFSRQRNVESMHSYFRNVLNQRRPLPEIDFVYISRALFALDVIRSYLLFGYVRVGDRFRSNESHPEDVALESVLPEDFNKLRRWEFDERMGRNFEINKTFKSDMSKTWFSKSGIVVVVPEYEYLRIGDECIEAGGVLHCEVDRFNKTEIGHYDMVGRVGIPKSTGKTLEEFEFYPLFKCSVFAPTSRYAYCSAFIPLYWITHTLIEHDRPDYVEAKSVNWLNPGYEQPESAESAAQAVVDIMRNKSWDPSPWVSTPYISAPG